jgi:hypothetical protein
MAENGVSATKCQSLVPLIIITRDVNDDSESELERKYKTKLKRGETLVA